MKVDFCLLRIRVLVSLYDLICFVLFFCFVSVFGFWVLKAKQLLCYVCYLYILVYDFDYCFKSIFTNY